MQLTDEQRSWLVRALESLAANQHRGFEDALWLGFGDAWWPLRERLVRDGFLELRRDETVCLNHRGRGLLEQLSVHAEVA